MKVKHTFRAISQKLFYINHTNVTIAFQDSVLFLFNEYYKNPIFVLFFGLAVTVECVSDQQQQKNPISHFSKFFLFIKLNEITRTVFPIAAHPTKCNLQSNQTVCLANREWAIKCITNGRNHRHRLCFSTYYAASDNNRNVWHVFEIGKIQIFFSSKSGVFISRMKRFKL